MKSTTDPRDVVVAQAAELARLRRDLAIERARRAWPIPDDLVEFVTETTEHGIARQVRLLSTLANSAASRHGVAFLPPPAAYISEESVHGLGNK